MTIRNSPRKGKLTVFLKGLYPALLILAIFAIVTMPEAAYSSPLSGDRPDRDKSPVQRDQGRQDERPRNDKPEGPKSEQSNSGTSSKDSHQGGRDDAPASKGSQPEKEAPNGSPSHETSSAGKPSVPPTQVVITVEPTATAAHSVAINSLSVDDPCQISGNISFNRPYYGTITVELTYHETTDGRFEPTGNRWTGSFSGEDSASFEIAPWTPQVAAQAEGRVNMFRLEIVSATTRVANMDTKSSGFRCDNGPNPTAGPTTVLTPTTTGTPVPPESTPTFTPTTVAPTIEPSATPTEVAPAPVPTSTGTPSTPTITPTVTPGEPPASTSTPGVTPTPTATTVPVTPGRGVIRIAPDHSANADPGQQKFYAHTVTNDGREAETAEIEVISSMGWQVAAFAGDGSTPLADTNGNGKADTGRLEPGHSSWIIVRVSIPAGATLHEKDTTIVSADPASPDGRGDTAKDITTINGVITMTLSTQHVLFGNISPSGMSTSAGTAVSSNVDSAGAYYARNQAVQVTITSNAPWTGTVQAQENSGSAATIRIADGDLRWRAQGDSGWTNFASAPSDFTSGPPGVRSYWLDYGLNVTWEDDPGDFDSVVTYNVAQ